MQETDLFWIIIGKISFGSLVIFYFAHTFVPTLFESLTKIKRSWKEFKDA